jgi:hypothetical protein
MTQAHVLKFSNSLLTTYQQNYISNLNSPSLIITTPYVTRTHLKEI